MRLFQLSLISALILIMAGCSTMGAKDNASTDYRSKVKQTKRMDNIPPDLKGHKQAYQVPGKQTASNEDQDSEEQGPSVLPPDSELSKEQQKQQAQKQSDQQHSQYSKARKNDKSVQKAKAKNQQKTDEKQGPELVVQGKNANDRLNNVQKALSDSNYEVLRVDDTQKDIFVLDTPSTHNRIDENTPLYRVHLENSHNKAKLKLYDEKNQLVAKQKADRFFQTLKHRL